MSIEKSAGVESAAPAAAPSERRESRRCERGWGPASHDNVATLDTVAPPRSVWSWTAIAGVLGVYAVLAFVLLAPYVIYSGDYGITYVQARELVANGYRSPAIEYRGAFIDPEARFTPFRAPFVVQTRAGLQAIFPPLGIVLAAPFVAIGDFAGMRAVSIVSAAVILWCAWRLLDRRDAVFPIVLGLATPLWFYAVTESEHAPSVAFGVAAFVIAARGGGWRSAALAGVLLGTGTSVRDEVGLLIPGLLYGIWLKTRRWDVVGAALAGAVAALGAAAAIEVWWFQRPLATHLRHAVHLLRRALQLTKARNPEVPELVPLTFQDRYNYVIEYWLLGYGDDRALAAAGALFAIALAARFFWRSNVPLIALALPLVALAAWDLWALIREPKWVPGMYRLSPFLLFLLLPARTGESAPWIVRVAVVAVLSYIGIALIAVDTSGGKSLGPRLLLPLLPVAAVAAWTNIKSCLRSPRPDARVLGGAGLALTAAALAIHTCVTIPAYLPRNNDDRTAMETIAAAPERVIVADDMFTAQQLLPLYYRRVILLADTPYLGSELAGLLAQQRIRGALVVSRSADPRTSLFPFNRVDAVQRGRFKIETWRQ
jgi:hypothetical protein